MNINKNNYEAFFIDYFDGNLSADMTAELFLFLESNPELKEEFNLFESIPLEHANESFPSKDALKRGAVNDENFDWNMAAATEGDLNTEEQELLKTYLDSNPQRKKDVTLFSKAKLDPGSEIFPNKNSLKQPVPFFFPATRTISYAIAAMLMLSLIVGGYYWFIKVNNQSNTEFAVLPPEHITGPDNNYVESTQVESTDPIADDREKQLIPQDQTAGSNLTPSAADHSNRKSSGNKSTSPVNKRQNIEPLQQIKTSNIEVPALVAVNAENKSDNNLQIMETAPVAENIAEPSGDSEQYLSVWEAIRQGARNNLNKLSQPNDEALASLDNNSNEPVKLFNLLGKGIEKVSNDKVNVESNYDENGKLSAFEFTAGKFKIERKKGF